VTPVTARLLDDGTGAISPPLKPLAEALAATPSPDAILNWLGKPHIQDLRTQLAAATTPSNHQSRPGIKYPHPPAGYARSPVSTTARL
jgi:hypothetical protein